MPSHLPPDFENKIVEPQDLLGALSSTRRPLVFTNGCFDLLHRGHVTYLAQAAALGKSLLVAVNSDDSVRRLHKGPGRPMNSLADRLAVLAALASVTLVTWFAEEDPLNLIMQCQPQVLVKGGDWTVDKIVGGRQVESWGGTVVSIPFLHDRSTTKLVNTIRANPL